MGDILAGFLRRSGALVSVEGREFRLGVQGGVIYVNGLPAEHYRYEAEGLLFMPDGSMHLPQAYLAAHGLPSMSLHPNEAGLSVRTGTRFYLHALPNGQVLAGGPGLAEHDLVLIRPGAEIQYGGPDGIVIQAQQQGKAILPQTGRETAFLAVGAALPMIVLAPWHFRRFWLSC